MQRFICILTFLGCCAAWSQTRMIPHVTRAGGSFTTEVIVSNLDAQSREFRLMATTDGGSQVAFSGTIAGNVSSFYTLSQLFQRDDISYLAIDSDEDVELSVAYAAVGNGSPAHVGEASIQTDHWRLFPGNWDNVFDGIAFVNMGSIPSSVLITQFDAMGVERMTVQAAAALMPAQKGLFVLGDAGFFSESAIGKSYFEVIATQPLAVVALRGSYPGSSVNFLWQNPALPAETVALP